MTLIHPHPRPNPSTEPPVTVLCTDCGLGHYLRDDLRLPGEDQATFQKSEDHTYRCVACDHLVTRETSGLRDHEQMIELRGILHVSADQYPDRNDVNWYIRGYD